MEYRVVKDFADRQDGYHVYHVGDSFPRIGAVADAERIKELEGSENALNGPVIVYVEVERKRHRRKKKATE